MVTDIGRGYLGFWFESFDYKSDMPHPDLAILTPQKVSPDKGS
jgi:hypothetical protein